MSAPDVDKAPEHAERARPLPDSRESRGSFLFRLGDSRDVSSEFRTLLGSVMDESGIDEALTEIGVGVLSMAADGVPYGVPLSFGYGGDDHLYFLFLGPSAEMRKVTYAEQSGRASFAAFDMESDGSWRSVIVEGPLERITPKRWDAAREAMADNAYKSDLLGAYEIQENPNVWALEIQERSGRVVGGD